MSQSSSPAASTLVKAAAMALAVPALLLPMKAAAQQLAANTPNYSRCDQMAQSNPLGASRCRIEVLQAHGEAARREGAAADVRVADANVLSKCLDFLKTQKAAGKSFDRPITRDNACAMAQSMGMHPN